MAVPGATEESSHDNFIHETSSQDAESAAAKLRADHLPGAHGASGHVDLWHVKAAQEMDGAKIHQKMTSTCFQKASVPLRLRLLNCPAG